MAGDHLDLSLNRATDTAHDPLTQSGSASKSVSPRTLPLLRWRPLSGTCSSSGLTSGSVCCHMPWLESGVGSTAVSARGKLPPRRCESGGGVTKSAGAVCTVPKPGNCKRLGRGTWDWIRVMNRIQGKKNQSRKGQPWTYGMFSLPDSAMT